VPPRSAPSLEVQDVRNGRGLVARRRFERGALANHSCRPNTMLVVVRAAIAVRVIRVIRPGDEVTHDYSTCLGADDCWTMRCNCGEPACRGRVGRFDRLPAAVLRRYIGLGAIPRGVRATGKIGQ